jgi:CRP-like cAMP-binding protein
MAELSVEVEFKAGERLFLESGKFKAGGYVHEKGEEATHLMLLTEGEVDIAYSMASGGEVVVGTLVAGDLMALSALIPPYHLTASGIAKSAGRYIAIEAEGLRQLMEGEHALGHRLMAHIAKALMARLTDTRVQLAGQT